MTVEAITLDNYFKEKDIDSIDLMKIDTEGTEHKVLEGVRDIILRSGPAIICEVLPGLTEKQLGGFFKGTNYKYFILTREGLLLKKQIEGDKTYQYKNY